MQERLMGPLRKAGSVFAAFSGPQRLIAAIGIAILLLGSMFFYRWASTPTLQPLFSNLAASDASAIVEQLDSQGVAYELGDGGTTIRVPQDQVYKLRLSMSSQGLPASQDTGYSLLDQQGVTASQFQQQVTWQRAMEGELAKTVKALDGVETAVVHLAIPKRDVFADGKQSPTASVLVTMRPGQQMPAQQVQSVVHLVASSVEGMDPAKVTVVDGKGQLLSAAGMAAGGGGMRDQQTTEYEQRVGTSLQALLDRVVGPGNAVATVAADLSFDSVNRTSETFTPAKDTPALTETKSTEKYTGNGNAATGVLGPDNTGNANTTNGRGNNYEKTGSSATNPVNKVTEQTTQAAGALTRQSVSVIVNSSAAGNVDMVQLKEAIAGAAGINTARGDSLSVTRMTFDTAAAEEADAAVAAAKKAEQQEKIFALARTGGIVLAALAICLIALLMTRRRRDPVDLSAIDDDPMGELDWLADEAADEQPAALPEAEQLPAIEAPSSSYANRRDEVVALVDNQPDEVAELLRGWLADRRS